MNDGHGEILMCRFQLESDSNYSNFLAADNRSTSFPFEWRGKKLDDWSTLYQIQFDILVPPQL
jgi:hypothetical protein